MIIFQTLDSILGQASAPFLGESCRLTSGHLGRKRNCSGVMAKAQPTCLSYCLGPHHCPQPYYALREGGHRAVHAD